jgi:ankyrin repeat protein
MNNDGVEPVAAPAKEIIKAAKAGDLASLRALLASDGGLLGARDVDGSTALHCAAWKGHLDVVAYLLSAGSDVHAHNRNEHWGTTALHAAAHANHGAIVQVLIEAGADVNATDAQGRTPLHHTTFHKAKAAAKVLVAQGAV